jgi:hypothetical protein
VYERGALPFLPLIIISHWPGASLAQRPIPFAAEAVGLNPASHEIHGLFARL